MAPLPWSDQLHAMATTQQTGDQVPNGHGDAIYLGWIGLGDNANPQPPGGGESATGRCKGVHGRHYGRPMQQYYDDSVMIR